MTNSEKDAPINLRAVKEYTLGCLILAVVAAVGLAILAIPINWLQARIVPWMFEQLPWLFVIAAFSLTLLQLILTVANFSLLIVVPVTLISLCFRGTRRWGIWGLRVYIATTVFGNVWMGSLIWTVNFAGVLWLSIGLLFGIVGVIPIAFVTALIHTAWFPVLVILLGLLISGALLFLSDWLESKLGTSE